MRQKGYQPIWVCNKQTKKQIWIVFCGSGSQSIKHRVNTTDVPDLLSPILSHRTIHYMQSVPVSSPLLSQEWSWFDRLLFRLDTQGEITTSDDARHKSVRSRVSKPHVFLFSYSSVPIVTNTFTIGDMKWRGQSALAQYWWGKDGSPIPALYLFASQHNFPFVLLNDPVFLSYSLLLA